MTAQIRNNEMVNLLRADFQARYETNFATENIIPAYMAMLGMRGFWPFSSVDSSVNLIDISGQGRTCTNNNTPIFNVYNLLPYATFNGSNQKFTRADEAGLDILGNESYIASARRGLTVCAWVRISQFGVAFNGIISKYSTTTTNSNFFLGTFTNNFIFAVYSAGSAYAPASINGSINQWYFICGRFSPSNEISLFVNGTFSRTAVAPATLNNSSAPLEIGAAPGQGYHNGDITMVGLYASYLSDTQVGFLFDQTRAGFNV